MSHPFKWRPCGEAACDNWCRGTSRLYCEASHQSRGMRHYWKHQPERNLAGRKRNAEWRERIAAIKLQRGCMDCGYDRYPEALDWDHRPGEVKLFTIGSQRLTWEKIEAEMAKCDVVCANCHRHRTRTRLQYVA